MEPLRLGCRADSAKVVEPALACLHKLVAYSYLQDESTRSGRLDDQTTVSQVRKNKDTLDLMDICPCYLAVHLSHTASVFFFNVP